MKKIFMTILIAGALSGCLVACGSNETGSTEFEETTFVGETTAAEVEETTFVGETTAAEVEETVAEKSSEYKKSGTYKEKVKCSMCNGTGKVKYYYGDSAYEAALSGHNDYEYGPCTSCDGTGYTYVTTSNSSGTSSNMKTCPSCGQKVKSLYTRKDAAGESRTWCSSCWSEYNSIMGN